VAAGKSLGFTIRATGTNRGSSQWDLSSASAGLSITPSTALLAVRGERTESFGVQVSTPASARPGDYQGDLLLTNRSTGKQLHVPVWIGVRPQPTKDVLLVDDDGSAFGFTDYAATYQATLNKLGVSYDFVNVDDTAFPSYLDLYKYRSIVIFTGDNNSFDTSGFSPADQDALTQWMDSGGRLWVTGQNQAETTDSNSLTSPSMGRSRLYHGYLGLRYDSGSIYTGQPPVPTANGSGLMAGLQLDLGSSGDGAHNQTSIEASDPFPNNDTFQAANTLMPLFHQIGGSTPPSTAISFARASEPRLEEQRVMYRYRSVSMGFGLEGINGAGTRVEVAHRALSWLLDPLSVDLSASSGPGEESATLTATPLSSSSVTAYRWDFGDGSPVITTANGTVVHQYRGEEGVRARVEVTDSLGHRSIGQVAIPLHR
jgi:hypothetical protein